MVRTSRRGRDSQGPTPGVDISQTPHTTLQTARAQMSTPGIGPGLSRSQRDVLTIRRCGHFGNQQAATTRKPATNKTDIASNRPKANANHDGPATNKHLWSSGYDVSLTRWRSPVRSRPGVYCSRAVAEAQTYTWPGSKWRPPACEADVIATRPHVLMQTNAQT